MAIKCGNMIVGGVATTQPEPVKQVQEITRVATIRRMIEEKTESSSQETHVKLKDGELERLIPKKSSYLMDLALGSE
jgi:hypothetical protein